MDRGGKVAGWNDDDATPHVAAAAAAADVSDTAEKAKALLLLVMGSNMAVELLRAVCACVEKRTDTGCVEVL